MILSVYVIGSAFALLVLSARLREARDELARMREEHDADAQAVRDEYGAYACGVTVSLACLLAALGAMAWHAPPRPAGSGRDSASAGTPAGEPGRGAAE